MSATAKIAGALFCVCGRRGRPQERGEMRYDPELHRRRSIRLKSYDYSLGGAYFVTICVELRQSLLGEVVAGVVEPNAAGRMVAEVWQGLPRRFPRVEPDAFVTMPNHFHGILILSDPSVRNVGAPLVGAQDQDPTDTRRADTRPAPTLGDIVCAFKSLTTDAYIHGVAGHGWPAFPGRLWQRNYYERILRDDDELVRARRYIIDNPARWGEDAENPAITP